MLAPTTASADGFLGSIFNRSKTSPTTSSVAGRQSGPDGAAPGTIRLTSAEFAPTPTPAAAPKTRQPMQRLPVNSTYQEKKQSPYPSRLRRSTDANRKVLSRLLPQARPTQARPPQTRVQQPRIQTVSRETFETLPQPPRPFPQPAPRSLPRLAQAEQDGQQTDDNDMPDDMDMEDMLEDLDDDDSIDEDSDDATDFYKFDRNRSIGQIQPTLEYAFQEIDPAELPKDNNAGFNEGVYQNRQMPTRNVHWAASDLHHSPLYFEDPGLERYGHTRNKWIQPFVSSGRFVGQTVGLPYQMAMDPPWTSRSPLGWYRPGECAPRLKYRIPVNGKGSAAEIITIVGLLLLIP